MTLCKNSTKIEKIVFLFPPVSSFVLSCFCLLRLRVEVQFLLGRCMPERVRYMSDRLKQSTFATRHDFQPASPNIFQSICDIFAICSWFSLRIFSWIRFLTSRVGFCMSWLCGRESKVKTLRPVLNRLLGRPPPLGKIFVQLITCFWFSFHLIVFTFCVVADKSVLFVFLCNVLADWSFSFFVLHTGGRPSNMFHQEFDGLISLILWFSLFARKQREGEDRTDLAKIPKAPKEASGNKCKFWIEISELQRWISESGWQSLRKCGEWIASKEENFPSRRR